MLLSVRGNHSAYLDLVAEGRHILNVLPGSVLEPWAPQLLEGPPAEVMSASGTFEVIAQTQP